MRVQRVSEADAHYGSLGLVLRPDFWCSLPRCYLFNFSLIILYPWSVQDMSLAAKEAMLGQLDMIKAKYDDAVLSRKKAEHDIESLRPVSGKCSFPVLNLVRI